MFRVDGFGQVLSFLLLRFGFLCRAVLEAEAVVSGFKDVAVVGKPVEQCGCHLGIAEDAGPFAEAQVGGDDDAGALIELAEKMKQQRTARGAVAVRALVKRRWRGPSTTGTPLRLSSFSLDIKEPVPIPLEYLDLTLGAAQPTSRHNPIRSSIRRLVFMND